jgi:hypothetical protein
MNRILVTRNARGYFAQFIGPHAARVVGLFGTDTLPCPFGPNADVAKVVAAIEANPENRGVEVLVAESARH